MKYCLQLLFHGFSTQLSKLVKRFNFSFCSCLLALESMFVWHKTHFIFFPPFPRLFAFSQCAPQLRVQYSLAHKIVYILNGTSVTYELLSIKDNCSSKKNGVSQSLFITVIRNQCKQFMQFRNANLLADMNESQIYFRLELYK